MSDQLYAILTFQAGYNTTIVLAGVIVLSIGGGVVGVFSLLRKRSLTSDAISHATLPGIALAFLIVFALTGNGRNLPLLLIGAAISSGLGIFVIQWIRSRTRLPEDTAIGVVLSVFFGLGVVLLSYIQTLENSGQAGLNSFLLGSTAALSKDEALWMAIISSFATLIAILFMKEFSAVAFDEGFSRAQGWSVGLIDLTMLALLMVIVIIGLTTVGLVLVITLVIIPPAAARLWTERLSRMVFLSGLFGGIAAWVGGAFSALFPNFPAGAVIVLAAATIFLLSLFLSPNRGIVYWGLRQFKLRITIAVKQELLGLESSFAPKPWGIRFVMWAMGLIRYNGRKTARGETAASDAKRQKRLWEALLRKYPEVALDCSPLSTNNLENKISSELLDALKQDTHKL